MFSWLRAMMGLASPRPADVEPSAFQAGEVWRYHTRPEEPDSTVTVLRVDRDARAGTIVHLRVDGLRVRNPHHSAGVSAEIMHMPFEEAAVVRSVTDRVRSGAPIPDHAAGYDEWRRGFDAGGSGMFTITIAEAVDAMEQAINA